MGSQINIWTFVWYQYRYPDCPLANICLADLVLYLHFPPSCDFMSQDMWHVTWLCFLQIFVVSLDLDFSEIRPESLLCWAALNVCRYRAACFWMYSIISSSIFYLPCSVLLSFFACSLFMLSIATIIFYLLFLKNLLQKLDTLVLEKRIHFNFKEKTQVVSCLSKG